MRKGRVSDCILTSHISFQLRLHMPYGGFRVWFVFPKIRIRSTLPHIRVNE
jgi:hypothetical protein